MMTATVLIIYISVHTCMHCYVFLCSQQKNAGNYIAVCIFHIILIFVTLIDVRDVKFWCVEIIWTYMYDLLFVCVFVGSISWRIEGHIDVMRWQLIMCIYCTAPLSPCKGRHWAPVRGALYVLRWWWWQTAAARGFLAPGGIDHYGALIFPLLPYP